MPRDIREEAIAEIDAALQRYQEFEKKYSRPASFTSSPRGVSFAYAPQEEGVQIIALLSGTLSRLAPPGQYQEAVKSIAEGDVTWGTGKLVGLLKALRSEYEAGHIAARSESVQSPVLHLDRLLPRFHQVAKALRTERRRGRDGFWITDEYDVQDLLRALLRIDFDDIRVEEWTPSYAGKAARMDFLLKKEQVVIEAKMTRDGLGAKELGDQLLVDIARYKGHADCRTLVCFVYDPEQRISNPVGLKNDLEASSTDSLAVKVYVCQH
jgi:REase_DpnII-MboI